MALTTTYVSGAVGANDKVINVNAFTSPASAGVGPQVLGRFATGEYVLITYNNSTALETVRGYMGSRAVALVHDRDVGPDGSHVREPGGAGRRQGRPAPGRGPHRHDAGGDVGRRPPQHPVPQLAGWRASRRRSSGR